MIEEQNQNRYQYYPDCLAITKMRAVLRKRFSELTATGRLNIAVKILNAYPKSYTAMLNMAKKLQFFPTIEDFNARTMQDQHIDYENPKIIDTDDDEKEFFVVALPKD